MTAFQESIKWQRGKRDPDRRAQRARSFPMTLMAFVLVGSVFFYVVNWFSEARRSRSDEVVQAATMIVLKKLPPVVGNELASILSNIGPEYPSAGLPERKAAMEGAQAAVDSRAMPIVLKRTLPPVQNDRPRPGTSGGDFHTDGTGLSGSPKTGTEGFNPESEEPDPASAIEYVFKKRRLSL
jgi:hypothetical protein